MNKYLLFLCVILIIQKSIGLINLTWWAVLLPAIIIVIIKIVYLIWLYFLYLKNKHHNV